MNRQKIIEFCEKAIVFSFYGLIYFLPIAAAFVETFSGIIIVSYFIKQSCLYSLRLKDLSQPPKNKSLFLLQTLKPSYQKSNWAIGVFMFIAFISVLLSQHPQASWKGYIFQLCQGVFLYFIFADHMATRKRLKYFVIAFMISATLMSANVLGQSITGQGFVRGYELYLGRVCSSFKHPNDFGGYLIVAIFMSLGAAYAVLSSWKKNIRRQYPNLPQPQTLLILFLMGLTFLLINGLGLTFSRGAWVGFFVGGLFWGIRDRKGIMLFIIIILLFFNIYIPRMEKARNVSFLTDNVELQREEIAAIEQEKLVKTHESLSGSDLKDEQRKDVPESKKNPYRFFYGSGRYTYWKEAVSIIKRYPLTGGGLNTYSRLTTKYDAYAHNCFLQIAAETGIFGLAAFLWFLFTFFVEKIKFWLKNNDPLLSFLMGGGLSALIGFLTHCFFDTNLYSVQLSALFWVIMGFVVSVQRCKSN